MSTFSSKQAAVTEMAMAVTEMATTYPNWYKTDVNVETIPQEARTLLESYSGLRPDQVLPHVLSVRDAGFEIGAYPCIGQLRFLDYALPQLPYYRRIVDRLRRRDTAGASSAGDGDGDGATTFLDAGCCFGQEIRYLMSREGIRADQLYGFDSEPAFLELGYRLFRDRERIGGKEERLTHGDLSRPLDESPNREGLAGLRGRIDIVYVSNVLHLWDLEGMVAAARRLVALTRDGNDGNRDELRATEKSMIVGKQIGSLDAGHYPMPFGRQYRHNPQTMRQFWDRIGWETGTRWVVETATYESAAIVDNRGEWWAKNDPNMCMINFCATRE